jgi:hypothetical protein
MAVQTQIQTRRGSAATWTSTNPTLAAGEIGFESDTNKFKIGTGSTAWVSLPYASNVSPLTTKGDLYTYSTDNARLAVGANGETLVADSSTSTGLRYQGLQAAGKNACINGGFDIWQRGTSFTATNSTSAYGADRWSIYNGRTGTTYSRQTSGLTGFQYSMRVQRDSGNTGTDDLFLTQCLESADSYRFAGQQVTLSFWAKAGANYSSTSSGLTAQIRTGTGTDQNIWAGYTGSSTIASTNATLTTSWQRFSITGTVASTATELCILFAFTPVGTAGANDWFEVTGVQLEIGSVATAFTRSMGTIQGELAACQRYYWNWKSGTSLTMGIGRYTTTTEMGIYTMFPVTMRTAPSLVATTGTNYYSIGSDGFNSFTIFQQDTSSAWLYNGSEVSGTAGANDRVYTNNAAASVSFSAEL